LIQILLLESDPAQLAQREPGRCFFIAHLTGRDGIDGVVVPRSQPHQEKIMIIGEWSIMLSTFSRCLWCGSADAVPGSG
jgi:hypothetical protein